MRRITTGLVFTLSATCSDLRGSSPDQAIKLKTCTATANLLFVDISNLFGEHGPPFCNHYSYNLVFVNSKFYSSLRWEESVGAALRGRPRLISTRGRPRRAAPTTIPQIAHLL